MNIKLRNIIHKTKGQTEVKLVLGRDIVALSAQGKLSVTFQQHVSVCQHSLNSASNILFLPWPHARKEYSRTVKEKSYFIVSSHEMSFSDRKTGSCPLKSASLIFVNTFMYKAQYGSMSKVKNKRKLTLLKFEHTANFIIVSKKKKKPSNGALYTRNWLFLK